MGWSRGMYSFVHTDELRAAYDTYKVIHTLAKEGFKDAPNTNVTNVYVAAPSRKRQRNLRPLRMETVTNPM